MIFINSWASYHPDDIPDLTPHDDEEMVGCLAGVCGFIVSTIIYVLLFYLCCTLTKGVLMTILVMVDGAVIYPILIICLMELSFKIGNKIYKNKIKSKVTQSGKDLKMREEVLDSDVKTAFKSGYDMRVLQTMKK